MTIVTVAWIVGAIWAASLIALLILFARNGLFAHRTTEQRMARRRRIHEATLYGERSGTVEAAPIHEPGKRAA